ncbi:hypothetical protein P171DRAFT_207096 [Karstenula rhodostoma CBS 690.94]|uniref:Ubiquitin 3 binding protein But2 C-terminal domain-containing protein n=1 Tax=Karstenula rhodostoma CBS 690.94 TaxID=1392251 RepID=A0A9P4UGE4_9PLEO|nr:hypothetical protein P171DRAFT_207096 [Karstenula rhodostoma CBS 690.94]
MLDLHTLANLLIVSFLLAPPTAASPLWPNTTTPAAPPTACSTPTCQTFYPTSYSILNSRYPTWDQTPLHGNQDFFMLLRQRADTFQVATQVQFSLPVDNGTENSSSTCILQFQLPSKDMQTVLGPAPVVNVYQVTREAGVPATWDTYEPARNASVLVPVFGAVNGSVEAQQRIWNQTGGLIDVGAGECNGTLTWQMGMAFEGGDGVNYWDFVGVEPPFSPVQGFRVVTGC